MCDTGASGDNFRPSKTWLQSSTAALLLMLPLNRDMDIREAANTRNDNASNGHGARADLNQCEREEEIQDEMKEKVQGMQNYQAKECCQ